MIRTTTAFILLLTLLAPFGRSAENRLDQSASTFVRGQAQSPIHWEVWGPRMLERAQGEDKPVYLFVGSFLNGMAALTIDQSFADPANIEALNRDFICVLVDQEEWPAVDAAVQHYLDTVKQSHGRPSHLWLTPEMQPFEGSGYLPPSEDWGQPGFSNMLQLVQSNWSTNPQLCRSRAQEAALLMAHRERALSEASELTSSAELDEAAAAWRAQRGEPADRFGPAPRRPEPELYRFLLRRPSPDRTWGFASLEALARSGLRDPLDGGFFRSSADAAGRLPHLQKTLSDQARLALAFLDASTTDNDLFARSARGALDFSLKTLVHPDGSFAAAQNATSPAGVATFTWTAVEIDALLGPDADTFRKAHRIQAEGNVPSDDDLPGLFRGRNILSPADRPETGSEAPLAPAIRERLLAARNQRPAPDRDPHATAGTHGLLLAALSVASRQLDEPAYLAAAERTFAVITARFVNPEDGSVRRLIDSEALGSPTDFLAVAWGCLEFSRLTQREDAATLGRRLVARAQELFFDPELNRFMAATSPLPPGLFVRAPAVADPLTAEALALMANAPDGLRTAIGQRLTATLNTTGTLPPGDVLLSLAP